MTSQEKAFFRETREFIEIFDGPQKIDTNKMWELWDKSAHLPEDERVQFAISIFLSQGLDGKEEAKETAQGQGFEAFAGDEDEEDDWLDIHDVLGTADPASDTSTLSVPLKASGPATRRILTLATPWTLASSTTLAAEDPEIVIWAKECTFSTTELRWVPTTPVDVVVRLNKAVTGQGKIIGNGWETPITYISSASLVAPNFATVQFEDSRNMGLQCEDPKSLSNFVAELMRRKEEAAKAEEEDELADLEQVPSVWEQRKGGKAYQDTTGQTEAGVPPGRGSASSSASKYLEQNTPNHKDADAGQSSQQTPISFPAQTRESAGSEQQPPQPWEPSGLTSGGSRETVTSTGSKGSRQAAWSKRLKHPQGSTAQAVPSAGSDQQARQRSGLAAAVGRITGRLTGNSPSSPNTPEVPVTRGSVKAAVEQMEGMSPSASFGGQRSQKSISSNRSKSDKSIRFAPAIARDGDEEADMRNLVTEPTPSAYRVPHRKV